MTTVAMTGSGSGIGAAIRKRLEGEGCEVIGVDLRGAEIEADLSTADGRQQAIREILDRSGGRLDRLVCCAGLGSNVRPASLVASVNYFGSVEVFDGLLEALAKGDDPACLVVVSNSAQMAPLDDTPFVQALLDHDETEAGRIIDEMDNPIIAYMGSKHALGRAIRRRVRRWGDAGVRLNGICPGPVQTALFEGTREDPATKATVESIDLPVGRLGTPEDIAPLASFLLGPDGAFIHGSLVYIDGGNDAEIRPDRY